MSSITNIHCILVKIIYLKIYMHIDNTVSLDVILW